MPTIRKILVANRGEVALRVMKTARALGIQTVAVYSSADAASAHVRAADLAVHIGDAAPSASYLNVAAVLSAAKASGADAVHPGYGFLAENADFAQACRDAGLTFIGPSAAAINAMGDKANAKVLMRRAGVPCVPGDDGADQNPAVLHAAAARVGYPVMIKATAGGGGRGMRIVNAASEFDAALASAKSEAANAFGSDRVILERVIHNPRHIEIQVVADSAGNAIHLGERDCSVQRRHQKVIEEAPGVGISEALRERMGAAAVTAALAIGYEGVGTLEFLLDESGEFYFMEMNTRLQVEHPVTEAITGLDLVELQITVAQGQPLPLAQHEVRLTGHAIEVRLCAEDEHNNFMPQSGLFTRWSAADGVRVETAVSSGSEMSPYYDSMFAKIIAYGRDREEARAQLVAALTNTVVFGVKTNKELLTRCLEHPLFVRGGMGTGFLEAGRDQIFRQATDAAPSVVALAAAALCAHDGNHRLAAPLGRPSAMIHLRDALSGSVTVARVTHTAANSYQVALPLQVIDIALARSDDDELRCTVDGVSSVVPYLRHDGGIDLQIAGQVYSFDDVTYAPASAAVDGAADGRVRAAMNGRVAAVFVAPGAAVKAGDPLLTLEAMKMEYRHCAPADGIVSGLTVAAGDQVTTGKLLVELTLALAAAT
ncbi:3-methylcrotonyl-CoA carboxylase [Massilia eurypsychrophila]|jgi:geranyl-CoA carboxylase alpha subunit|uniref:3-methylcrotonyl-CoA carboxylase n=1 Tax=Massilia eurypsychrophila TaxID=1485217 RepID=A0A2G8TLB1_9BURK|nr:acetyl-CoA carboxylase biotin carboxylase subunit [Massilia eurypsychrophila]PIL46408.1 3-methylcrotonyl-CoA carboxylase [Massilia eurypsychrophila]